MSLALPTPDALRSLPEPTLEYTLQIPVSAHTLAGFRAWAVSDSFPERGRISFLDQEIFIDMSPEELHTHNQVKSEIYYVLLDLSRKRNIGQFLPDGMLLTNKSANLSTEPDGLFVTWKSKDAGRVRRVPHRGDPNRCMEIEGSPDWVLEVVSDSSVRKDTVKLRERYHLAGVPEYWLVDARGEKVDFQILLHDADDYVPAPRSQGGWQASRVFGRRFRLTRRRRADDWVYTLGMKPLR